jgi:uncharacterized protein involved in exopolysaccharide biosynthesis
MLASDMARDTAPGPVAPASPFDYLSLLVLSWRLISACALATALAALAITFLVPKKWTAKSTFLPVSNSTNAVSSALGNIAGNLGISLPGTSPSDGPEFYVSLIKSRGIQDDVLKTRFPVGDDSLPLLDILEAEGEFEAERLEDGRDKLEGMFSASSDRATSVVAVRVTAEAPELAAAIANRFVELANKYNRENRGFQARETRRFVEERLQEAEGDLRDAENALREFRTRNRRFETPELQLEDQRLQRQVQLQQNLYLSLRQQYESARIQEVNDTPVLSVIERAIPPVRRSSPRRGRTAALALVFGAFIGAALTVSRGVVRQWREAGDPGFSRLERALGTAFSRRR